MSGRPTDKAIRANMGAKIVRLERELAEARRQIETAAFVNGEDQQALIEARHEENIATFQRLDAEAALASLRERCDELANDIDEMAAAFGLTGVDQISAKLRRASHGETPE